MGNMNIRNKNWAQYEYSYNLTNLCENWAPQKKLRTGTTLGDRYIDSSSWLGSYTAVEDLLSDTLMVSRIKWCPVINELLWYTAFMTEEEVSIKTPTVLW